MLFDRTARRLFGDRRPNSAATRATLDAAIRRGTLENGSDLATALEVAAQAAGDAPGPTTLVVVLSDGLAAFETEADAPIHRVSDDRLGRARVLAVTLTPPGTPAPAIGPALQSWLDAARGRAVTTSHAGASSSVATALASLEQAPGVTGLRVDDRDSERLVVDVPDTLSPGAGFLSVGTYSGRPPTALQLVGRQGDRSVTVAATRPTPRLAVAARLRDDHPERPGIDNPEVVHGERALVALDPDDAFARDRLALVDRWGEQQYGRVPPPPETRAGHTFAAHRVTAGLPAARRRTGSLDRDIAERLIRTHVVPGARHCYNRALRQRPKLSGSLTLVVDMVRGEVHMARTEGTTLAPSSETTAMLRCVVDAAYKIQVPTVALGDALEPISRIRYPLGFSLGAVERDGSRTRHRGRVELGRHVDRTQMLRRLRKTRTDPLEGIPMDRAPTP